MVRGLGTNAARRNGPSPDMNSLRTAKKSGDFVRIPRNIREGKPIPGWPRWITSPTDDELSFWNDLWKLPQAEFWERDGMFQTVAMYVRTYISSMQEGGFVTEKTAAHRQSDALLLTTPALLAAKVIIVDETEEPEQAAGSARSTAGPKRNSVRSRFTVVTPSSDEPIGDENESSTSDD